MPHLLTSSSHRRKKVIFLSDTGTFLEFVSPKFSNFGPKICEDFYLVATLLLSNVGEIFQSFHMDASEAFRVSKFIFGRRPTSPQVSTKLLDLRIFLSLATLCFGHHQKQHKKQHHMQNIINDSQSVQSDPHPPTHSHQTCPICSEPTLSSSSSWQWLSSSSPSSSLSLSC